jgi:hypothetical protein
VSIEVVSRPASLAAALASTVTPAVTAVALVGPRAGVSSIALTSTVAPAIASATLISSIVPVIVSTALGASAAPSASSTVRERPFVTAPATTPAASGNSFDLFHGFSHARVSGDFRDGGCSQSGSDEDIELHGLVCKRLEELW